MSYTVVDLLKWKWVQIFVCFFPIKLHFNATWGFIVLLLGFFKQSLKWFLLKEYKLWVSLFVVLVELTMLRRIKDRSVFYWYSAVVKSMCSACSQTYLLCHLSRPLAFAELYISAGEKPTCLAHIQLGISLQIRIIIGACRTLKIQKKIVWKQCW